MLGESGELRIGTTAGEDLRIPHGDHPAAFPLECARNHGGPAALLAAANDLVDKVHEILREPDRNLPAHPNTVPILGGFGLRLGRPVAAAG